MSQIKHLHVHLGGTDETHAIDLQDGLTLEALAQLLGSAGKLGEGPVAAVFFFEEDSDLELPHTHRLTATDHGKRFHAHRCSEIKVTFLYADEKLAHAFRPSATIGKLLRWAKENFPVDKNGKYALRLTADGEPLPHATHLGSLVKGPCAVTLYFAPACRIQG